MRSDFLATFGAGASPSAVVIALVASSVLLAVRAWAGVVGLRLTRVVSLLLGAAILLFLIAFAYLVILRFQTLA